VVTITVGIVLHESARDIRHCLAAVAAQSLQPSTVVVFDNASLDNGLDIARRCLRDARLERSEINLGFAAGHNRIMALVPADVHVLVNPDCRLAPTYIEQSVAVLRADPRVGSVSGRLLRYRDGVDDGGPLEEVADDLIDSTGMVAHRNRRILDRSSEERARGRDVAEAEVFGVTGAAAVYRRAMLDDVAFEGEIFDESFFAYREDADLAWRAQLLGWRCRYIPTAIARHRRRVAPGRRRALPDRINRMSTANRWRIIAKNETLAGWLRDAPFILGRDAQIIGYSLLREQRSLPAIIDVLRDAGRLRAWRSDVMRRRCVDDESMIRWFGRESERPVSQHR
jgi:GT2 family glycosyltransferase